MPYTLDFAVVLQAAGDKMCVFKIISLNEKVKVSFAKSLCFGTPSMFNWGADVKAIRKAIQHMLENMGGFNVVCMH